MKNSTLNAIKRIIKKVNGSSGHFPIETSEETVKHIAENYPLYLAAELESLNKKAAHAWESYASNPNKKDSSGFYYGIMEEIVKPLGMTLDYPGLYVTYELTRNGKKFTEYSPENAIKQYNNFWNHW